MRDDGTIQPAKVTHFTEQGFTITGVMHAGMNDGEEVYSYKDLGIKNILGFEPLPQAAQIARDTHGVQVETVALANKDGSMELHTTGGDGKGSTLLSLVPEHPEFSKWRDVDLQKGETITVPTMKFTTWAKKGSINLADYDCLVLDTQGNEMDILLGMGELLQGFKFLSIELSQDPVYEGETPASQVCAWLAEHNFTQDSPIQSHNDIMFVRSDIKPISDQTYRGLA